MSERKYCRDMFGDGRTVVTIGTDGSAIIGHFPDKRKKGRTHSPTFISVYAEDRELLRKMLERKEASND